ncbi:hypothetical protein SAMN05421504_101726 [Amycolatopsis xylanica]|uniref:Uncharacterized protein n=1 Tax=Amycolatopsis xylanica TaxID=589385 RepID=A0A1H2TYK3_9PSEU|nr:hypothetical protein [Amycolatopsis xylanica]SDW48861.1 hypothetical protein SAMN05421504_101726 [Amycolatopsis xylanica]
MTGTGLRVLTCAVVVTALIVAVDAPPETGLDTVVSDFTAGLSPRQVYHRPQPGDLTAAATGFAATLDRRRTTDFTKLGFSVRDGTDPATGRPYTIAVNERAWGMYVIDRSAPPSVAVEVPHPASDLRTELIGVDLFRREPGAVLLVAGTHRKAADVAHEPESVFHTVATVLARRGLAQVQLHGFDDQNLPATDIVLSSGIGVAGETAWKTANRLAAGGFAVCRAWREGCDGLEGMTNMQGEMAAAAGTVFLHVEMSRTVRESPARRADAVRALSEAE